jgi:hypothetical protein
MPGTYLLMMGFKTVLAIVVRPKVGLRLKPAIIISISFDPLGKRACRLGAVPELRLANRGAKRLKLLASQNIRNGDDHLRSTSGLVRLGGLPGRCFEPLEARQPKTRI